MNKSEFFEAITGSKLAHWQKVLLNNSVYGKVKIDDRSDGAHISNDSGRHNRDSDVSGILFKESE